MNITKNVIENRGFGERRDMTLRKANFELKGIENQLKYYLDEKERLENKGESTEEINKIIDDLYQRQENIDEYIIKELKRLEEYDEMERLIIYYKDEYKKKLSWLQITKRPGIYCSVRQAQRIYRKHIGKRDIE